MPRQNSEAQIQCAIVQHLEARAVPGVVWYHPANGEFRNKITGARLKKMGLRPGVADLIFLHNRISFALELKSKNGRLSPAQRLWALAWKEAGGLYEYHNNLDDALDQLWRWGLLRPAMTMRSICDGLEAAHD